MNEGRELWKKYCGFFDKSFSEQVEYNEKKREEYFEKWKRTKMASQLCPKGVEKFEDVPLTTYKNYPILHEFGEKIEKLERTVPRKKGELWSDYYDTIGKQVSPVLNGWMVDEYGFCAKTSGTTSKPKWFAYGKKGYDNLRYAICNPVIACSNRWGETDLREGDKFLNIVAPVPYISGYYINHMRDLFTLIPSIEMADNTPNMSKRLWRALEEVEKGNKIDVAGGISSMFYMFSRFFTKPEELFREYYKSLDFGIAKLYLFLKYIRYTIRRRDRKNIREVMPVKGICMGGFDTSMYIDLLKKEYGVTPTNGYGATELGPIMHGYIEKKEYLMPDMRNCYMEFLAENGKIMNINELEMDKIYELVATPYGGMIIRYMIEDLFKVVDLRDDGLPIFSIEGRKDDIIDILGYFRLSQRTVVETLSNAGVKHTDAWVLAKIVSPNEHLLFLMERKRNCSPEKMAELLFQSLRKVCPEFNNYVKDLKVRDPDKIIKVEYLRRGTFMRYALKKSKEGSEIGNIKPPKMILPHKIEILDVLRGS